MTSLIPQDPQYWQLPVKASTFARDHDNLYTFVEWINYIFFFGIMAVLFYAVVKYRRRTPDQPPASTLTHHTALEVTWTVIPLIIVMVIFAWGWKGYSDMSLAPANSLQYEVKGERWVWNFKHPNSTEFIAKDLWVPVGTPCQLTMSSKDVLHSFYIPAFRVKRDVLPGRYQTVWFEATVTGDFDIYCTEFCGDGHSKMLGRIHVVSKEKWAELMEPGADVPWSPWGDDPVANGEIIYKQICVACHSLDGTRGTGPSFKGLWDRNATRLGGEDKVTAYIKESIRNPNAYIAEGFTSPSAMIPYNESALDDEKVEWVTAFIKAQK